MLLGNCHPKSENLVPKYPILVKLEQNQIRSTLSKTYKVPFVKILLEIWSILSENRNFLPHLLFDPRHHWRYL